MKWLVTVSTAEDQELCKAAIIENEGLIDPDYTPIPLGENEMVFRVEGSPEMADRLANDQRILNVYPDSEMTAY